MSENQNKEHSDDDLNQFEEQPAKTKELQRLKDLAEKSAGRERAGLNKEIRRSSDGDKASG